MGARSFSPEDPTSSSRNAWNDSTYSAYLNMPSETRIGIEFPGAPRLTLVPASNESGFQTLPKNPISPSTVDSHLDVDTSKQFRMESDSDEAFGSGPLSFSPEDPTSPFRNAWNDSTYLLSVFEHAFRNQNRHRFPRFSKIDPGSR